MKHICESNYFVEEKHRMKHIPALRRQLRRGASRRPTPEPSPSRAIEPRHPRRRKYKPAEEVRRLKLSTTSVKAIFFFFLDNSTAVRCIALLAKTCYNAPAPQPWRVQKRRERACTANTPPCCPVKKKKEQHEKKALAPPQYMCAIATCVGFAKK